MSMHFTRSGVRTACGRPIRSLVPDIKAGERKEVFLDTSIKEEHITCEACMKTAISYYENAHANFEGDMKQWAAYSAEHLGYNPYKFGGSR